jgi:calcineurin-like phosphoesterase family protein
MRYFTADLHLTDERVKKICHRPDNVDDIIIDNINKTLKDGDTLYIIGDLFAVDDKPTGFGNGTAMLDDSFDIPQRVKVFSKIRRGIKKVLVLGNHDDESFIRYFNTTFNFDLIVPFLPSKIGERDVFLAHDPSFAVIVPDRPLICGHVHGLFRICRNAINVGVDQWGYMPVSEVDLERKIDSMVEGAFSIVEL